jgi:hypothetical protein
MFRRCFFCAAALCAGLIFSFSLEAGSPPKLTPAESRGKVIYTTGKTSAGKRLSYRIASGDDYLPARGVGCENCHGDDGKGRQGDVLTPAITYETLSNPFTFRSRERLRYSEHSYAALGPIEGGTERSSGVPKASTKRIDASVVSAGGFFYFRSFTSRLPDGCCFASSFLFRSPSGMISNLR